MTLQEPRIAAAAALFSLLRHCPKKTIQPPSPLPKQKPKNSSTSGAAQPAAPLPEDPQEKRLAKNNFAYTKDAFLAFYGDGEYGEQKWADAPPQPLSRRLPAFVTPLAESIVQEIYEWYEARVGGPEMNAVMRHLQNTLFKNVTVQLPQDVWKPPEDGGASHPAVQGEAQMVVSREYVARQVQKVISWREQWLHENGLSLA